jgi:hypothetical protein
MVYTAIQHASDNPLNLKLFTCHYWKVGRNSVRYTVFFDYFLSMPSNFKWWTVQLLKKYILSCKSLTVLQCKKYYYCVSNMDTKKGITQLNNLLDIMTVLANNLNCWTLNSVTEDCDQDKNCRYNEGKQNILHLKPNHYRKQIRTVLLRCYFHSKLSILYL